MLRWADIAMYEAKQLGCATCEFDADLERSSVQDLILAGDLDRAISAGEISVRFQPQVDLLTGELVGAEALSRWHHPTFGLLAAERFIRLLQVSDQFPAFTRAVLEQSARAQAEFRRAGLQVDVAVNVAARSLLDRTLSMQLAEVCLEHHLPPNTLTVEITEDDLMGATDIAVETLSRLRAIGFRVTIDDFGTGHSSFARLVELDVDEIKLDRRFLSESTTSARAREVIASVIAMSRRLGQRVIAEGIERPEQAELLRKLGCRVGQGYLYGMALSVEEFIERARTPSPAWLGRGGISGALPPASGAGADGSTSESTADAV